MNRSIINILCAAGLLVLSCTSKNDATRLGLLGNVKTITDTTTLITSQHRNVQQGTYLETEIRTFSRSGFQKSYQFRSISSADTIESLIQEASIQESRSVQPIYFETLGTQRIVGSLSFIGERPTEIICYDSTGAGNGKIVNTYGAGGHLRLSVYYDATGSAGARYTFVNDSEGRPTEIICYDPLGNWTIRNQYLNGTHIKHTQRNITYY